MIARINRREFTTLIGGAAAWPLAAQQRGGIGRVGVLLRYADGDPEPKAALAGFRQGLKNRGWQEGGNLHIDYRSWSRVDGCGYGGKGIDRLATRCDLYPRPDLGCRASAREPHNPIVFVQISDPIGSGFIASLSRPGGNAPGLLLFEAGIAGKLLQMLKEIAPHVSRVALLMTSGNSFANYLSAVQAFACQLGIDLVFTPIGGTEPEISSAIESFARVPNGGLVLLYDNITHFEYAKIADMARRLNLPSISSGPDFAKNGGLMDYGPRIELVGQYRQAAIYVDRILRGTKPGDLPVQAVDRYTLIVNLKTAKTLRITVPYSLLITADEVIE